MPLISVIIPVYNAEQYIESTINSILNQTIKDIEIILVNDGSTDDSGLICDNIAQYNKKVKVVHQKNKGVSTARNKGIDEAQGDYIAFVDADDEINSDMYEFLLSQMNESDADISMCGVMIKQLDGVVKYEYGTEQRFVLNKNEAINAFLKGSILNISMNTKLIKRELFNFCKFDDQIRINEDKLMLFQCLLNAEKIVSNDVCKYTYIKRKESVSEEEFSVKYFDIILVANKILYTVEDLFPHYVELAKRNHFLSHLYLFRMLTRKNQYKKFKNQYLGLKKYIQSENCLSFYSLLSRTKRIEYILLKNYFILYKPLLKVYDIYNIGVSKLEYTRISD